MKEKISLINQEVDKFKPLNLEDIEAFRIKMLGKKGLVTQLFSTLRTKTTPQSAG